MAMSQVRAHLEAALQLAKRLQDLVDGQTTRSEQAQALAMPSDGVRNRNDENMRACTSTSSVRMAPTAAAAITSDAADTAARSAEAARAAQQGGCADAADARGDDPASSLPLASTSGFPADTASAAALSRAEAAGGQLAGLRKQNGAPQVQILTVYSSHSFQVRTKSSYLRCPTWR